MLAKVWKKALLAICIVACIYNIMSKLVNRASLEENLKKANDGNTVFDFSSKDSDYENASEIVDGVIQRNVVVENNVNENIQNTSIEENIIVEEVQNETEVEENKEETSSGGIKFTDLIFKW